MSKLCSFPWLYCWDFWCFADALKTLCLRDPSRCCQAPCCKCVPTSLESSGSFPPPRGQPDVAAAWAALGEAGNWLGRLAGAREESLDFLSLYFFKKLIKLLIYFYGCTGS